MSAWIEISFARIDRLKTLVALYMSAWIEISRAFELNGVPVSRTLHECVD